MDRLFNVLRVLLGRSKKFMLASLLRAFRLSSTIFEFGHKLFHGCSLFVLLHLSLARGRNALTESNLAIDLLKLTAEPVTALFNGGKAHPLGHVVMVEACCLQGGHEVV